MTHPCKHLDYSVERYGAAADLMELDGVKWWVRKAHFDEKRSACQFCGNGRGRIRGIFQCYNEGEMPCYQPAPTNPATP